MGDNVLKFFFVKNRQGGASCDLVLLSCLVNTWLAKKRTTMNRKRSKEKKAQILHLRLISLQNDDYVSFQTLSSEHHSHVPLGFSGSVVPLLQPGRKGLSKPSRSHNPKGRY